MVIDTTVEKEIFLHNLMAKSHFNFWNIALRGFIKTVIRELPTTPSSGIEPGKGHPAEKKARKATPETANHQIDCWFVDWSADAPKTNQSPTTDPVGCLEHPAKNKQSNINSQLHEPHVSCISKNTKPIENQHPNSAASLDLQSP